MTILRRGSSGSQVVELQRLLNEKLYPSPRLSMSGSFLEETEQAVRTFQRQYCLPQDGVVDPLVIGLLRLVPRGGFLYVGMDRLHYPGDRSMEWLRTNTNLAWTGFYLAPAPSQPNTSWMTRRGFLVSRGWGVACIYVGQQQQSGPGSHILTGGRGTRDGRHACHLAARAGFPSRSCIYLDVERRRHGPRSPDLLAYYGAWAEAVTAAGYRIGVYAARDYLPVLDGRFPIERAWTALWAGHGGQTPHPFGAPHPSSVGYARSYARQYFGPTTIQCGTGSLVVDLNIAVGRDPSDSGAPGQDARLAGAGVSPASLAP